MSGRRPVSSDTRLGLHNGNCVYARSNRTPRDARRSMFGVLTMRMAERPHVVVEIVGHDDEDVRAAAAC